MKKALTLSALFVLLHSASTFAQLVIPPNITQSTTWLSQYPSIQFNEGGLLTISQSSSGFYQGNISGPGDLTIQGGGDITLTGNNTYTGLTTISDASNLIVNVTTKDGTTVGSIPPTGSVTLGSGALTFNIPFGSPGTFYGNISGAGALNLEGGGTLTLSGMNTYTGGTILQGQSTLEGTTETLPSASPIVLNGSSSVNFNEKNEGTYAQAIRGIGAVFIEEGIITFTGPNTYTGGTTIDAESSLVVSIGTGASSSISPTGPIQLNDGNLHFNQFLGGEYLSGEYLGVISGQGTVYIGQEGDTQKAQEEKGGSIEFTGKNIYTGGTVIYPINTLIASTETISGNITNNGTMIFSQPGSPTPTPISYVFLGDISGAGDVIVKRQNAGLPFILNLAGTNSYTGSTTVDFPAILQGKLPENTSLFLDADATYDLNGANQSIGSLEGVAQSRVKLGANTLTVGNNNKNATFAGTIQDAGFGGGLIKVGTGNLTLANSTSYTGTTVIDEGTLTLNPIYTGRITNIINNSILGFTSPAQGFYTFYGNIGGTGNVIAESTGAPFTLNLAGTNSYTGSTTIGTNTTLQAKLPESTFLSLNAGGSTYELNGADQNIVVLEGRAGSFVNLENHIITVKGDSTNKKYIFAGSITGKGQFVLGSEETRGVLELIGTNTYTGNTLIFSGSTLIGSAYSFPPMGSIRNSGIVVFNQSTAGTYAGTIVGSGNMEVTGGGKLTLSGIGNSYKRMTINKGTTLIGNTSTLPAASIVVGSKATLIFNQNFSGNFSGDISGKGLFQLQGGGALTLTGKNTYTGDTNIANDGSRLIVTIFNKNSSSLPITGSVIDDGSLTFDQPKMGIFSFEGHIKGLGEVVINGPGTVNFSRTNTYTGGTIINAQSSLLCTTSTIPAPKLHVLNSGNIIDNGTLTFNQDFSGTFAGNISGSGKVVIERGNVSFTGMNTFTGGITTRSGGSYTGNTDSITGNILNYGNVTFDQIIPGIYTGTISGSGVLIKRGVGSLTLTGISPFSGTTTVKEGALRVQGSLPNSHVVVDKKGALKGTGKVGSADIAGTIMPGSSIGEIGVIDDLGMRPSSIYEAEVSVNGSDTIRVGGKAQLDGILDVRLFQTTRPQLKNKNFTILTSKQARQGAFTPISKDRIKYTIQYFTNSVQIFIGQLQDFADASSAGSKNNVARTERYFDTFADNTAGRPDLTYVIHDLDTLMATDNPALVNNAFNQIQPAQYGDLGGISFLHNELVNKTVSTQQQYLRESRWIDTDLRNREGVFASFMPKELSNFRKLVDDKLLSGFNTFEQVAKNQVGPRANFLALGGETKAMRPGNQRIRVGKSSLWVQSYGQIEKSKSNHGNPSIRSQTGGLSIGGDHEILCNTYLGILGGFSTTPFHWGQDRGYGRMKSYYGGLYGTWLSQTGLYADGQILAGGDQFHSKRNIKFPDINRVAKQSHKAGQFSVDAEVGYAWMLQPFTLQPFLDGTYMFAKEQGFREKGAQSLNFNIKSKTSEFLRGEVGVQIYRTYVLCDALVRPAFQLSYVHKHPISGTHVKGGIIGEPQTLPLLGGSKVRNQVAPSIGVTVQFAKGLYIIANVSAQLGSDQNLGDALLRVGYDF